MTKNKRITDLLLISMNNCESALKEMRAGYEQQTPVTYLDNAVACALTAIAAQGIVLTMITQKEEL